MHYQISRNGQMYGPYTMEDLQRYIASGHVLLTDLAKSEEMPEWIPVSQLLGTQDPGAPQPSSYAPAAAAYPGATAPTSNAAYADPPNLHWAIVLLLDLVTCSLFQLVWNIIISAWFRRVVPPSKAMVLYIASAVLLFAQFATSQVAGLGRVATVTSMATATTTTTPSTLEPLAFMASIALACWVVRLVARFTFRSELEQHFNTVDPIGLRINPVLLFFFGGIYLQSQLNRINDIKQAMRYR